jgi:hypothetical protein
MDCPLNLRKQANKEWFGEECGNVNEEKNAAIDRAFPNNTRGAKNAYKLAWTKKRLDEEASIENERHQSA